MARHTNGRYAYKWEAYKWEAYWLLLICSFAIVS